MPTPDTPSHALRADQGKGREGRAPNGQEEMEETRCNSSYPGSRSPPPPMPRSVLSLVLGRCSFFWQQRPSPILRFINPTHISQDLFQQPLFWEASFLS